MMNDGNFSMHTNSCDDFDSQEHIAKKLFILYDYT